ncbi:hypothetical protein L1987_05714 [Smallanthus sonchifolius]|uniref:Uncharacterized protein n=1 Tax=Smallanthus sonchifolius TaxID=185202 RepID=A0ACB9JW61_9ASTR|nr:hypothetical protein L1987_05714 [Smallanthus sonchifolius]
MEGGCYLRSENITIIRWKNISHVLEQVAIKRNRHRKSIKIKIVIKSIINRNQIVCLKELRRSYQSNAIGRINWRQASYWNIETNQKRFTDKASMLDEAIEYLKQLQLKVHVYVSFYAVFKC